MTIDQYLEMSGRTAEDLAAASGITPTSLSRIRRGNQNTTRDVMRSIIAASGDLITADALVKLTLHAAPDTAADAATSPDKSGGNIGAGQQVAA